MTAPAPAAGTRILVTGVAGFIGSNLAAAALGRGYQVVGVDDMSQGDELNLAAFRQHPAFAFHRFDVRDQSTLAQAAAGCQTIVHLAAFKIPRYSDALDTLLVNVHGTESVAEVASASRAKVVAASTSDVYGKNRNVPFSEDAELVMGSPDVRRWAYAISKMFDEQLLLAYHERFGIDVVLLRFFGGYGPNQNLTWWGGPQSVFINAALDGKPCEVHGDGQQTRSFTHVSDHVDGILRCIENDAARNQVFNIGRTDEITIEALARLIWRFVHGADVPPR